MTDKELRRLSRRELLEMMLEQSRENDRLRQRLQQAEEQLAQRQILLEEAGTIAEASLLLNELFATAQQTADQYVMSVKAMADRKAGQILAEARQQREQDAAPAAQTEEA